MDKQRLPCNTLQWSAVQLAACPLRVRRLIQKAKAGTAQFTVEGFKRDRIVALILIPAFQRAGMAADCTVAMVLAARESCGLETALAKLQPNTQKVLASISERPGDKWDSGLGQLHHFMRLVVRSQFMGYGQLTNEEMLGSCPEVAPLSPNAVATAAAIAGSDGDAMGMSD